MNNQELRNFRKQEDERRLNQVIDIEVQRIQERVYQSARNNTEYYCNIPIYDKTLYAENMHTIMERVKKAFPETRIQVMLGKQIGYGKYTQQKEITETLLKIMDTIIDEDFFARIYGFGHHLNLQVDWSE